jgi:predicted metal-dependent hydrolase
MKLDPDLKLQILEKIGIYSNRFSIPEPKVLLTTKEVVSYFQHNLIFINVRKIPDEKNLEDTMVHELLHLRFPYLAHGKRFNKLVRQGLRGKTFLPYRKRAKTSAI